MWDPRRKRITYVHLRSTRTITRRAGHVRMNLGADASASSRLSEMLLEREQRGMTPTTPMRPPRQESRPDEGLPGPSERRARPKRR